MKKFPSADSFLLLALLAFTFIFDLSNAVNRNYLGDFDEFLSVRGAYHVQPVEGSDFLFHSFNHKEFDEKTIASFGITPENGNTSGYLVLLKGWIIAFGTEDLVLRLFSIVCHLAFVICAFFFCRQIFKNKIVFWISVFLMSFNPIVLNVALMIRAYSLSAFLALLSSVLFMFYLKKPSIRVLILYVVVALFGFTVHFLSVAIIAAHFGCFLLIENKRVLLKHFAIAFASIAILCATFLSFQIKGLQNISAANKAFTEKAEVKKVSRQIQETNVKSLTYTGVQYGMKYFYGMSTLYGLSVFLGISYIPVWVLVPMVALLLFCWFFVFVEFKNKNLGEEAICLSVFSLSGLLMNVVLTLVSGHILPIASIKYSIFTIPFFLPLLMLLIFENKHIGIYLRRTIIPVFVLVLFFIFIPLSSFPSRLNFYWHFSEEKLPGADEIPLQLEMYGFRKFAADHYTEKDTLIFSDWRSAVAINVLLPAPKYIMLVDTSLEKKTVYLLKNNLRSEINRFPHKPAY